MRTTLEPSLVRETTALERHDLVVGVDEVGRGAIAGPLVVGAVALDALRPAPSGLRDSKELTPAARESLVGPVRSWAHASGLGSASVDEVEQWGLRWALALAVDRALSELALDLSTAHVVMDGPLDLLAPPGRGPTLRHVTVARTAVIGADRLCASVAAASVLAKVQRDETMVRLGRGHPEYVWDRNKGYGTPAHYAAIAAYGATRWHRRSWLTVRDEAS